MKKVEITTSVINGKIQRNRELLQVVIEQFNGKDIVISISQKQKKRSLNQNAYYWKVIVEFVRMGLVETTGDFYTKEEAHEVLKSQCNFIEIVNTDTGECKTIPKSTTANSTKEQEQFHEACRRFAKDFLNITIPLPNEDLEIE